MIPANAEPLLLAQQGGGYQITRSLRFNSADSAYLSRTPASAGDRKTWTWAGWVKRSLIGGNYALFGRQQSDDTNTLDIRFGPGDTLRLANFNVYLLETTQVFRDTSAWFHLVVVLDTTQATANNRARMYVNGSEITTFGTRNNPTQNADLAINNTTLHHLGATVSGGSVFYPFSGYLADIHFIDGQALTPSSFGETDATTGEWIPKAYTGTYGTNGFKLNFSDNSAATATTLGADSSGNGNNWTPTNLSVTAGADNDSLVDTPTSYGTDTGVGGEVRGNYCLLNPLDANSSMGLANGSLDVPVPSSVWRTCASTFGLTSGKWYWEILHTGGGSLQAVVGVAKIGFNKAGQLGLDQLSYGYYNSGEKTGNGNNTPWAASWTTNDIIGVAFDADNGTIAFYKNNVSQGTAWTGLASGPYMPAVSVYSASLSVNFGQRPFAYTAPSGFKALCDTNLPAPVVAKPSEVMDVKLYTGNGSTQTISGLGFSPDLVWTKSRSSTLFHHLYDTIRGTNSDLSSNSTSAESTGSPYNDGVTAFNSNGYTLGAFNGLNENGTTYVAWTWDAGSSTVTNTSGSISSQVRANASAGFSIVSYTGTGANATVGHGLGVAPSFIVIKGRSFADSWVVYHAAVGAGSYLKLESTAAAATSSITFNNTSPTASVFSVGTSLMVNTNTGTHVAYCFAPVAGYSAFGSYTGNGSTDGPFVYTGFRPRWLLWRANAGGYDWRIIDTARDQYNASGLQLYPNTSGVEVDHRSSLGIDLLSNGFKLRNGSFENTNAITYIYAAFAESPFAYARAR